MNASNWNGTGNAAEAIKKGGRFQLTLGALGTLAACLLNAAELPNAPSAGSVVVKLNYNVVVPTSLGPSHSVSFTYTFPEPSSVYIPGLGEVPSSGTFAYLTTNVQISFLRSAGGPPLGLLDLKDATRLMGKASIDLPAISDFPSAYRVGFWRRPDSFAVHAIGVLNEHFQSGFMLPAAESTNSFLTTYRALSGLPDYLIGEVAILLSYGQSKELGSSTFHVRFKARERRTHTRWRYEVSQDAQRAAEEFVEKLLAVLQAPPPTK